MNPKIKLELKQVDKITIILEEIQSEMLKKAKTEATQNTIDIENYDELKTDVNIKLMSNRQITLKHEEKYDFDMLSKNWGFYITPSFFSRCKSFNLLPLLLEKKDCVYLKILLVDKYSNKNLKLNDEYMKSIIHFNEPRKDSNINFINEVRGLI